MRNFWWIGWFLYEDLPTVLSLPISSSPSGLDKDDSWDFQWEHYWFRYSIGLLSVTATILTIAGCLCCQKRRPKGFQDEAGNCEQEFKDGSSTGNELAFERSIGHLELEVPQNVSSIDRVQFEPITVERFVPELKPRIKPKPPPPSPSLFGDDSDQDILQQPCREWFDAADLYIPREKLKYVREIGRGWFGKVVEGRADLNSFRNIGNGIGGGSVVVRILMDEATNTEKTWFLGEATPYLKLHHRNILTLLGSCLETDPYLLLFESCPLGDLKGFLGSNRDVKSMKALTHENIPIRMALEIAAGLKHMHNHGFAHTDLSARNCLIASDLTAKLGDYGTGVEKYPEDYYVVGDRALPIRWSAPESMECTETTIETRTITIKANIWSYGIFLWEIATWGERPYDNLDDEQVIETLLVSKTKAKDVADELTRRQFDECSLNIVKAIRLCLNLEMNKRPSLDEVRRVLCNLDKVENFEQRWENLKPNVTNKELVKSASLQDLRGSIDSERWSNSTSDGTLKASFRLGPGELVKNIPGNKSTGTTSQHESGSETEEESWRGKVERGVYTEKVKQKSKSVADLMVLVHIDSDSDAEWSLGPQILDKSATKKRLSTAGSDGDLPSTTIHNEFDEALRKLRDPIQNAPPRAPQSQENYPDVSKVLTLTTDSDTPILRLSFEPRQSTNLDNNNTKSEEHVLRLSKEDPDVLSLLKYVPDSEGTTQESKQSQTVTSFLESSCFSNNFSNVPAVDRVVDVELWNHALDSALEQKVPGFSAESEFNETLPATADISAPDTPQSRGNYSDFSNGDDLYMEKKDAPTEVEEEEEDHKRLSTPDDERSSDSGFRDKESCEEEESPLPPPPPPLPYLTSSPIKESLTTSGEEEQLRILFELDTILDAEYYGTLTESEKATEELPSPSYEERTVVDLEDVVLTMEGEKSLSYDSDVAKESPKNEETKEESSSSQVETEAILKETEQLFLENEHENIEDEDSSTMSLRSDNSYVSFGMEDEFVAAIRNELREKLPRAQMSVVEAPEPQDDEEPSITSDTDSKRWDDDENEDCSNGVVDIAIRYNIYGTPLSPILEERESAPTTESLMSKENSQDESIASRDSVPSEDMILVDTRTNKVVLLKGMNDNNTNEEISDEESGGVYLTNADSPKGKVYITSGTAPLPSPEEEQKWQQSFPLPLQMQDDLMSTSFGTERGWDSQDEEEEGEEIADEEEDEGNSSSSSGEFIWKRYEETQPNMLEQIQSALSDDTIEVDPEEEMEAEDDEEEEEFTPSAWDATLAPHRSALRSPDKTIKSGDGHLQDPKRVWFKKQRYHCVYEYPKENPAQEGQDRTETSTSAPTTASAATTTWEPTSYTDWEEMMDEPRLDLYPLDYDENNHAGDEEFYVSSSNRPFQFSSDGRYVSQFFPGASSVLLQQSESQDTEESLQNRQIESQQQQLGELRHTRDRLKLNLLSPNGTGSSSTPPKQVENVEDRIDTNLCNEVKETVGKDEDEEKDSSNEITQLSEKETISNLQNEKDEISEVNSPSDQNVDIRPSDSTGNLETTENKTNSNVNLNVGE